MNYIFRMIRGGSFADYARYVRSGQRYRVTQDRRDFDVGFRLARTKALHSYPLTLEQNEAAKRAELINQIKVLKNELSKLERMLK
jgi:hypothetical protein